MSEGRGGANLTADCETSPKGDFSDIRLMLARFLGTADSARFHRAKKQRDLPAAGPCQQLLVQTLEGYASTFERTLPCSARHAAKPADVPADACQSPMKCNPC